MITAAGLLAVALVAMALLFASGALAEINPPRAVQAGVQALTNGQVAAINGGQLLLEDQATGVQIFLPITIR